MNIATSTTADAQDEDAIVADSVGPGLKVLDCGCGGGRIARALVQRGCRVDGIEISGEALEGARDVCGKAIHGSITDPAAWEQLGGRRYDAIVYCHVLEHLLEPLATIDLARKHLAPNGKFVIALPNVATWRMRLNLLRGRWDYADEGILDRTHVKFYTLKTARELLASAGLEVEREQLLVSAPRGGPVRKGIVSAVRSLSPLATTPAFLFVARPRAS